MLNFSKFIEKFLKLSKRDKYIVYIFLSLVVIFFIYYLIIKPIYTKINIINKQIREKEEAIKRCLSILSQKDKVLSEIAKYAPFLHNVDFDEKETPELLKKIEDFANKSSVYIVEIKPQGIKEEAGIKRFVINLTCEAQMEQLLEFMYNIENSTQLLLIAKYSIIPKSKESSIAVCSMVIYKMIPL